jgi:hypothetical protein
VSKELEYYEASSVQKSDSMIDTYGVNLLAGEGYIQTNQEMSDGAEIDAISLNNGQVNILMTMACL